MAVLNSILQFSVALLASTTVIAAPLEARGVINHDKVVPIPAALPGGTRAAQYKAYQPSLKVINGCVPFPAVDAKGNTSGGLQEKGSQNGGCSKSEGQIYVRSAPKFGKTALMYSWYFPKDSPSDGLGHRHDWEAVVVWLNNPTATDRNNIFAVCASAHGGFECDRTPPLTGTSPNIRYESTWPVNHALDFNGQPGGKQPMIAWESMPDVARIAISNYNWGAANVPFEDSNFGPNLEKAKF